MEQPILRAEHEEFKARIEEHLKRNDRRIGDLEELTASVHSLAISVENIAKSQSRQEEKLEELESRDGDTWRKVKWYLLTLAIGAVFGLVASQIGL